MPFRQGSPMDRPPGGSREGVNLGGSSGSTVNPTSKKIPFLRVIEEYIISLDPPPPPPASDP